MVPEKTIGRLSLYRRLLAELMAGGSEFVFSHELAALSHATSSQVRRDLMAVGATGSPSRGYDVRGLLAKIETFLDPVEPAPVALIGVGNLGRAILAFFQGRRPKLSFTAAFDKDPAKVDRVIQGCRCYGVERLEEVLETEGIRVAVIAVPAAEAQSVAERLIRAGVTGILNFAPVPLRLGPGAFVENIDMTMSLEKVAHFALRADREDPPAQS